MSDLIRNSAVAAAAGLVLASPAWADVPVEPDPPHECDSCEGWNVPAAPFRIHGDTYYVGTAELAALLIASDEGHILLDAALPQSAPLIADNIRALGFEVQDIRLIVNSHDHYDHAGGIAAFQRATGAVVAASPAAALTLERGQAQPDDPQYLFRPENDFPPVANVRRIADGERLTVGGNTIAAVFTPGHTPGGTSWTWRSCEDGACVDIVYADSLTAVSHDDYLFSDHPEHAATFAASIARIGALPCDILIAPHPGFVGLMDKAALLADAADTNPFIDDGACAAYAGAAAARLEERLASEQH